MNEPHPQSLMPNIAACAARETQPVEAILSRSPMAVAEGGVALSAVQLRRVALFIESNLEGDLSLATLATITGLSPSHFARRFKAALAQAPHRYVLARRVNAAKRMLLETNMPLAEVAAAVGFSSQAHFTGMFGRATGITPGAYRTRRDACMAFLRAGGSKEGFVQAA